MSKSKSTGRPKSLEGRVTLNLTVPPFVAEWLKATGNASAAVRSLVESEISTREGAGWKTRDVWNDTKPVRWEKVK